ncbi:MAG: flagellar biosynthetic protein FliO [Lacunisphaera sp.]
MTRSSLFTALRLGLLAWALGSLAFPAFAAPAEEKAKDVAILYPHGPASKTESAAAQGSMYGSGVLVVALLLAGAGGWLFWRGRAAPTGTINARKLTIAETKSLGSRQYLVVAAYEDRKFLLSVCPGKIELLTPLDGGSSAKSP